MEKMEPSCTVTKVLGPTMGFPTRESGWDLITELPNDWGNLEGTNKTLSIPGPRRKEH